MSSRWALGAFCASLLMVPFAGRAAELQNYQGYFSSQPIKDGLLDCYPTVYSKALHKIQLACSQSYLHDVIYLGNDVLFIDIQTGHRHHVKVSANEGVDFVTEAPLPKTSEASIKSPCSYGGQKQDAPALAAGPKATYSSVASTGGQTVTYSGDPAMAPHVVGCGIDADGTLNLFVETGRDKDRTGQFTAHDLRLVTAQAQKIIGSVDTRHLAPGHVDSDRAAFYQIIDTSTHEPAPAGDVLVVVDLSSGDMKTYVAKPTVRWLDYDPGTRTALIAFSQSSEALPRLDRATDFVPVNLCEASIDTQTCLAGKPVVASQLSIFTPMFSLAHRYANGDGFMPLLQTKAINGFYWF